MHKRYVYVTYYVLMAVFDTIKTPITLCTGLSKMRTGNMCNNLLNVNYHYMI